MRIINHLLQDTAGLSFEFSTPNCSGEFRDGLPDTLVIHFTGGSSAISSARHLCQPSARASAHLVVGREGEVYQLAPFNQVTWHAGASSWEGRTGLNHYSIGIELDNAGQLTEHAPGVYRTWFEKTISPGEVFFGRHRNQSTTTAWHAYTEKQILRTFALCEVLVDHYPIARILGHEEIAPVRKLDPGPAFPLDKLRAQLLENPRNQDAEAVQSSNPAARVIANRLNVRSGPGVGFPTVDPPLVRGEQVRVLHTQDG